MFWRNADVLGPFPTNMVEAALWEEHRELRRARVRRVVRAVGLFLLGVVLALALAGCGSASARYVAHHRCEYVDHTNAWSDWNGTRVERYDGFSTYACHEPDVRVYVDDSARGGR